jgi:hypothetical protein
MRVEPELMSALLELATKRKVPLGPMVRQWVQERIEQAVRGPARSPTQLDKIERKIDKLISDYKNNRLR